MPPHTRTDKRATRRREVGCVSGTAYSRSVAEESTLGRELPAATATKTAAPPKGRHRPSRTRSFVGGAWGLHTNYGRDDGAGAGGTGGVGEGEMEDGRLRDGGHDGVNMRVLLARSARFSPRRRARPRSVLAARCASTRSPRPRCGCQPQRRPAARDQGVQALQARRELRSRASGGVPERILAEAARPPPPGT